MDRTTRALGTLTLAMTLAFALEPTPVEASTQSRQGRELTLAWFSGRLGYPVHFETMAREVDRIFEPIGVEVSWEPATSADTLKVILLPIEPSLWNLPPRTMGVYLGDDGVQPAVYIFVRNVLRALALNASMQRIPTHRERQRIGRALGKVVGHEIIHVLTPDCTHETEGLMRRALGRYLLLNQRDHLEPKRVESIYRGLRQLNRRSTAAVGNEIVPPAEP